MNNFATAITAIQKMNNDELNAVVMRSTTAAPTLLVRVPTLSKLATV